MDYLIDIDHPAHQHVSLVNQEQDLEEVQQQMQQEIIHAFNRSKVVNFSRLFFSTLKISTTIIILKLYPVNCNDNLELWLYALMVQDITNILYVLLYTFLTSRLKRKMLR
jgi:hypothetical protein